MASREETVAAPATEVAPAEPSAAPTQEANIDDVEARLQALLASDAALFPGGPATGGDAALSGDLAAFSRAISGNSDAIIVHLFRHVRLWQSQRAQHAQDTAAMQQQHQQQQRALAGELAAAVARAEDAEAQCGQLRARVGELEAALAAVRAAARRANIG